MEDFIIKPIRLMSLNKKMMITCNWLRDEQLLAGRRTSCSLVSPMRPDDPLMGRKARNVPVQFSSVCHFKDIFIS